MSPLACPRHPSVVSGLCRLLTILLIGLGMLSCGSDEEEGRSELCPWFQVCGTASDGGTCGECDDGDPCTSDSCVDGRCRHIARANTCSCEPSCGGPDGRLVRIQTLAHGAGGLPDPSGVVDLAVTGDGAHVYVASRDGGRVAHFVRQGTDWRFGESSDMPGIEALALVGESHVVAGAADTTRAFTRDPETGRLTALETVGPGALALLALGGARVVSTDGVELRVSSVGPGGVQAGQAAASEALEGTRRLAVDPDGRHAYAAGFLASTLSVWQVEGPLPVLVETHQGKAGLSQPSDVAIGPGGGTVYVTGYCDHDIAVFTRDAADGTLTWAGSVYGGQPALGECVVLPDTGRGPEDLQNARLANPVAIAVSANGQRVAVAAPSTGLDMLFFEPDGTGLKTTGYLADRPAYEGFIGGYVPQKSALDDPSQLDLPEAHRYSARVVVPGAQIESEGSLFFASSLWPDLFAAIEGTTATAFLQGGAGGVDNLAGAYNLESSPDERHVYVAPRYTGTIAPFAIDDSTGGLTPLPIPVVPEFGPETGSITNVDVSRPDGAQVYAVDANYGRLLVFSRDVGSGQAAFLAAPQLPSCDGEAPFPVDVVATEDGLNVLVADFQFNGRSCLLNFTRTADGGLVGPEVHNDEFLGGVEAVALTEDGAHLYAACHVAGSVAHYERDPATGSLTARSPLLHPQLDGAEFIILSPDEAYAYVTSPGTNVLMVVARGPDGAVTPHQIIKDGDMGAKLVWAAGIAVSPDGAQVWAAGRLSNAINLFARQSDGTLVLEQVVADQPGLQWVNGLELTADGSRLYSTAVDSNTINFWRVARGSENGCLGSCP